MGTVAPGDRVAAVLPVADFFERNLRHQNGPAAGQPFVLGPWQREFVDELYRLDERGNRIYKRAILGVPRGNRKSTIAAAVSLYDLMTQTDEPDIICAGRRQLGRLCPDEGGPRAGLGHGALRPRRPGALSGLGREGRGVPLRVGRRYQIRYQPAAVATPLETKRPSLQGLSTSRAGLEPATLRLTAGPALIRSACPCGFSGPRGRVG
jgi:hypothetical protein